MGFKSLVLVVDAVGRRRGRVVAPSDRRGVSAATPRLAGYPHPIQLQ